MGPPLLISRAKASAKSAACKSNLRQIGVAFRLYVDDCGKYPLESSYDIYWSDLLRPYYSSNENLFHCPSAGAIYEMNGGGTDGESSLGLGGLPAGTNSRTPTPESRVLVPSDMIAVLHENGIGDFVGFGWPGYPYESAGPRASGQSYHQGGDIGLFCDDHVESRKSELIPMTFWHSSYWMFTPTATDAKRWNIDNQPHPETWPENR